MTDPIEQARQLSAEAEHLYGVTKRTKGWFTMNLATRTVTAKGTWAGYGEIQVHQGQVFSSTNFGGGVHLLGPGLTTPTQIATGLGDEWYTVPDLAFEPASWRAWTLAGRDLARIRLEPGCPVLNVATS